MSELIVSPGVYTQENDNSFTAPGIAPTGLGIVGPTLKGQAFVPTIVTSYNDFVAKFGPETPNSYVPYSVRNYFLAGNTALVTRILGNGGWNFDGTVKKLAAIVSGSKILVAFHPSQNDNDTLAELSLTTATGSLNSFNLTISGSQVAKTVSGSLNFASSNYITKVLGNNQFVASSSAFPYLNFSTFVSASVASGITSYASNVSMVVSSTPCTFTSSNASGYSEAMTPWIVSAGGVRLFRIHHISHGTITNQDVKIAINNISISTTSGVNSTFGITVRKFSDTDNVPSVLEQFANLSVNINDNTSFVGLLIGDKYQAYDSTLQKVITYGNYPNSSNYIRLEFSDAVRNGSLDTTVYPAGFEAVYETIAGFAGYSLPSASMVQSSSSLSTYSGFDYTNTDNLEYLSPVPQQAVQGLNAAFYVNANDNKFIVPFQGGTDGINYATKIKNGSLITSTNMQGYDLSTSTSPGSLAYQTAIAILSNTEQYAFNIFTTPGVINSLHSSVINYALSTITSRADSVYFLDLMADTDTIATAVLQAATLNSSYGAAYYPWVKIQDSSNGKIVSVPPSVVVPQVIAYNDSVSNPWWAPAGLNRGGIGGVIDTRTRMSKADRDTLYQGRVNPIANFPNTGISIWGQKTLLLQNTALNRINVRRLLIELKYNISNIAKYLVFEQNDAATRNQFLNRANPYMQSVQSKRGLYAYKIIMDDTNNTGDVIDRNQLVGDIYIYPTKSAEFILLNFNIEATTGLTTFG